MKSKEISKYDFWLSSLITTLIYGLSYRFSMSELIRIKGEDPLGYISFSKEIGFHVIIYSGILIHVILLLVCRGILKNKKVSVNELLLKKDSLVIKLTKSLGYFLILLLTYNYFASQGVLHLFSTLCYLIGVIEIMFAIVWIGNIFKDNQKNEKVLVLILLLVIILIGSKYIPFF